ncbi:hypothetical protein L4X63_15355 [Geomonas sp. Red32]|uniref:hypothetical protein n=1 Tax=Geomonas sp. Red32 TaxID=2912856 RepID=UPI00202D0BE5|nr:hypothetical protein [Geomonas sp. Red32]MCM0082970.1 hypothetical protein [Geomonas sp. Red32]
MGTLHRKDIIKDDLTLLARFSHALTVVAIFGRTPVYEVGEITLWLPVWKLAEDGSWQLDKYKTRLVPAIGITKNGMRLVSRYLQVKKSELIRVLFKLSVISVAAGCHSNHKPEFRQNFRGESIDSYGFEPPELIRHGYLFEKRRATLGGFR